MYALLGLLVATVALVSGREAEKLAPRYLDEYSVDMMKAGLRIQYFSKGSDLNTGIRTRNQTPY